MSMERNTPVDLSRSAESFIRAFECILDTMAEENRTGSIEQRKLSAEQLKSIHSLHNLLSVGGLKPEPHASETLSYCDGFISEWESTRVKSAAVQQLISLLNRPHVRGVLVSVEDISACRYHPQLPPVPFEVDEDEGIAVKIVRIVKRDEPLGATIKSDRGRIYIARIIAGGVADRSACIQEGDRVLEVNGLSVADLKVDDVARLLNRSENGSVTFKLVPVEVPHGTSDRSHIHLRAQFDYDGSKDLRHPCPEAALSFKKGDILELLVCNDEHWWQARRLGYGALANIDDGRCSPHGQSIFIQLYLTISYKYVIGDSNTLRVGLIPSEMLQLKTRIVEKEEKQSMGKGSVLSRNSCEEDLIYESVCRLYPRPRLVRPVVLIGPPGVGRAGEIDGVDYYFVSRIEMENMIHKGHMLEFGEYRGMTI
uniref:MAGUK p55 subfamily member 7 n=1 Tax=Heterorhabditis bacteriophora TaxID=37862 RepID=A0A1I7XTJ6_HETBA